MWRLKSLQEFLESKRNWIYTKLAANEELHRRPVEKELVDGESFVYLGRNYRLQIVDESSNSVRLVGGRLRLPAQLADIGRTPLTDWYRVSGRAWVAPKARDWSERLRVHPGTIEVTDLGRKWGSATPGGNVRLHWAAFQLSPVLIDYVVAHELAHLREPHHGPAFWQVLGRALPDFAERKNLLARVGANLWFGEIAVNHK
ncbi:M48 family metallopeptidase [Cryobacterium breve]|uniref:M48 family metallopeptidase n=1 Tax=Cryobacterium breve TaxID=1259258 RepID=A0ABY7NCG6_9MICO|nr:SprT family zinc-dependent metalloprotease [Cryobacterium breve]WBM80193.1 M48 family metallopeptidase [Cryobacterium breve]